MTVEQQIAEAFAQAGVTAGLHAVDLATGRDVAHHADESQVLASVFKVPVLVALLRSDLDLTEQVTVPVEGRTAGPTGLSKMTDPATMSLRDLARLMIVVSDNAATDVVMARLGLPAVKQTLADLGLHGTDVGYDVAGVFQTFLDDAGVATLDEFVAAPTAELLDSMRALRRDTVNVGTARDLTRLLTLLWDDVAASPERCALGRDILLQQVWPHRLASGFPEDGVTTGGKTGTLPRVRNEVGVVTYPDGGRYAVAVFTTAESLNQKNPAADAVIGRAARLAVDALRA